MNRTSSAELARMQVMLGLVRRWRTSPDTVLTCPECSADGLRIIDQSARPHVEWYVLRCQQCGLDETVSLPMGRPTDEPS